MRIRSIPHLADISGESGINTVIRKYFEYLPRLGVKLVDPDDDSFDILHVHAGMTDVYPRSVPIVSSLHGLYWTADYDAPGWEWRANQRVIKSIRAASVVTVPSEWVGETLKRDMHLTPLVVPHGIDWELWQHNYENEGYVIAYAKNRAWADVSIPTMATDLAREREDISFVATFAQNPIPRNMQVTGVLPHSQMKRVVQRAAVFVSPVKETFGIAALEAMAAGVPVLTVDAGQVPELVQHGVGGYCYQEDNMEDMLEGLDYCLQHRRTLGANARELAKQYSWEEAAVRIRDAYDLALNAHTGTIGVVIPVYNKEIGQVARAIDSVLAQSRSADQIVVVDDGSDNGDQVAALCESKGVSCLRQENRGVAHARNAGIAQLDTEYVVCLDADDAIAPEFLEVCSSALDEDRSLYIAYTKIEARLPDGSTQVSQWPGQYEFDQFLERRNQVPTCCMFRRVMWERLGGYRQRYAPTGAGAEDAEFWFRAGAMGYRGELVASEPLFLYSLGSGHTSQSGYQEVDWLSWHAPWLHGNHPFASLATPEHGPFSHPVRQYDNPLVSIIIPVGPGHAEMLWQVLDSIEAQTFFGWEVIVVNDTGEPLPERIVKAYPFATWMETEGAVGAGAARNLGASQARGHLLLFVDADDWIYPEFLEQTTRAWIETENAVYTDYIGIAYVDNPDELSSSLRRDLLDYDADTKQAVIRYRPKEYLCERAMRQPEGNGRPYLWCNITTLLPKKWHDEIGGFDEEIESWEDVDYWWRIAKAGHCFTRIEEPLMVYRFYTGKRRDSALRQFPKLLQYLQRKHEEIDTMGCGCSGKTTDPATYRMMNAVNGQSTQGVEMQDKDYVMVTYLSTNQGQHPVYGARTREFYGYRSGSEKFLVHRDDVSAQPHLFRVIREERLTSGMKEPQPVGAPQPLAEEPGENPHLSQDYQEKLDEDVVPVEPETDEGLDEEQIQEIIQSQTPLNLSDLDLRKEAIQNLAAKGVVTEEAVLDRGVEGLQDIKWVGEATAVKLVNMVRANRGMDPVE